MSGAQLEPALGQRRLQRPAPRERLERLAGVDENCPATRRGLIAPHDHVDVERIELDDASADSSGLICGNQVEPERTNGSMMMSPRLVRSSIASSSMAVGLTVGWSSRPRRASEPSEEAPG